MCCVWNVITKTPSVRPHAKKGHCAMKLVVRVVERPSGMFTAWCPALPGCSVLAPSSQEARDRIRIATEGYLASLDVAPPDELKLLLETEVPDGAIEGGGSEDREQAGNDGRFWNV